MIIVPHNLHSGNHSTTHDKHHSALVCVCVSVWGYVLNNFLPVPPVDGCTWPSNTTNPNPKHSCQSSVHSFCPHAFSPPPSLATLFYPLPDYIRFRQCQMTPQKCSKSHIIIYAVIFRSQTRDDSAHLASSRETSFLHLPLSCSVESESTLRADIINKASARNSCESQLAERVECVARFASTFTSIPSFLSWYLTLDIPCRVLSGETTWFQYREAQLTMRTQLWQVLEMENLVYKLNLTLLAQCCANHVLSVKRCSTNYLNSLTISARGLKFCS